MKALIRNDNEVITEENDVAIDWNTGMPLTSPHWAGGPYTLVHDYTPPIEGESGTPAANDPETVIIDGVEYRRT